MAQLNVGDRAPDFTLPNQDGEMISLSDYAGRRVVVYFYPKDDTPGCTAETCQFNDLLDEFSKSDVDVLGVSADDAQSHQAFRTKYDLNVKLLSDTDHHVMRTYGAWDEKVRWNGRRVFAVIRSTFIVGPDGTIFSAWYNVNPYSHSEEVRAAIAR